jgi:hypothetical protein
MPAKFNVPGRICAKDAAAEFGLDPHTLYRAIDEGIVRGEKILLGQGGKSLRHVDPVELEQDLAKLPLCAYCGEKPALAPSGACCGPHARALETRGTKRPAETCRRISAGKKGKPRPDVRERVAAMHADREIHYRWNIALVEGRARRITVPERATIMRRRAKGRLGGLLAARERGTGAPTVEQRLKSTEEGAAKLAEFDRLREKHPTWGRPTLVASTGLTDSQVRALLN